MQNLGASVPIHLHPGVLWDARSVSSTAPWGWSPHPYTPWGCRGPKGGGPHVHLGLCETLGLGVPPCTSGLGGPYQGILVDIGPLNLLGPVPSQNHGSAQHIQVLLQGHRTQERTVWE